MWFDPETIGTVLGGAGAFYVAARQAARRTHRELKSNGGTSFADNVFRRFDRLEYRVRSNELNNVKRHASTERRLDREHSETDQRLERIETELAERGGGR